LGCIFFSTSITHHLFGKAMISIQDNIIIIIIIIPFPPPYKPPLKMSDNGLCFFFPSLQWIFSFVPKRKEKILILKKKIEQFVCEWTHCFTSKACSYYITRLWSDLGVSCQFQLPVSSTMASSTLILNIIFRNVENLHSQKLKN
jgi:hypothetical protein